MKDPREVDFAGIAGVRDAERNVLRVRFAECLEKQHALNSDDDDAIHAFRLSCKRLRYAIERLREDVDLSAVAAALENITDELGSAHDCVVLARYASDCNAARVVRRAMQDRGRYVRRAKRMWSRAFRSRGIFEPLASFTGFQWALR